MTEGYLQILIESLEKKIIVLDREQVQKLQELIRDAVDKGVTIEAQEKRNKAALEAVFRMKRQEIRQMKVSTSAATKYYKSMSRINNIDPQLMDKKK